MIRLSILFFSFLISISVFAEVPCNNAQGSFHINPDGIEGGFVAATAKVGSNVTISRGASVCEWAEVFDDVKILDRSKVFGRAKIYSRTILSGHVKIHGKAVVKPIRPTHFITISGHSELFGNAQALGNVKISGSPKIYGEAVIKNNASLFGNVVLYGDAVISGNARLFGNISVAGSVQVSGDSRLCDDTILDGSDVITGGSDHCQEIYDSVTQRICPDGGEVILPNVGSAIFIKGSFYRCTDVTLKLTRDEQTAQEFDETAILFYPGPRNPEELRIDTGEVKSQLPVTVTLDMPSSFVSTLPADAEIQSFVQIFQDQGGLLFDPFELVPSILDFDNNQLIVNVEGSYFTKYRKVEDTFEAIVTLGSTLTGQAPFMVPEQTGLKSRLFPEPDGCAGFSMDSLLDKHLVDTAYDRDGTATSGPMLGTIIASDPNANQVKSPIDGTIFRSGFQTPRKLPKPHPSGETEVGMGYHLIVENDLGRILIARLDPDSISLNDGDTVKKGDPLATPDLKGRVHLKQNLNPKYFKQTHSMNPNQCIGANVQGDLIIGDNGPDADDAFRFYWDGVPVGETKIGKSNTITLSNLKPGVHKALVEVTVAPDEFGTWGLELFSGMFFTDDGTTQKSDAGPMGAEFEYDVTVPQQCIPGSPDPECQSLIQIKFERHPVELTRDNSGKLRAYINFSKSQWESSKHIRVQAFDADNPFEQLPHPGKDFFTDKNGLLNLEGISGGTKIYLKVYTEMGISLRTNEEEKILTVVKEAKVPEDEGSITFFETHSFATSSIPEPISIDSGWECGSQRERCNDRGFFKDKGRFGGKFAILDTILKGYEEVKGLVDFNSIEKPLTIKWLTDTFSNPANHGGAGENIIELTGTVAKKTDPDTIKRGSAADEFNESVILHEYFHYLQSKFSRSDSPGGPHNIHDVKVPSLALSEGLATAFSSIVIKNRYFYGINGVYQQESMKYSFVMDLEDGALKNIGWYNEYSIAKMIYDLWDTSTSHSSIDEFLDPLVGIKIGTFFFSSAFKEQKSLTTIFSYLYHLKESTSDQALKDAIDDYVKTEYDIMPVRDEYGDTQPPHNIHFPDVNFFDKRIFKEINQRFISKEVVVRKGLNTDGAESNELMGKRWFRFSSKEASKEFEVECSVPGKFIRIRLLGKGVATRKIDQISCKGIGQRAELVKFTELDANTEYIIEVVGLSDFTGDSVRVKLTRLL